MVQAATSLVACLYTNTVHYTMAPIPHGQIKVKWGSIQPLPATVLAYSIVILSSDFLNSV
jgi:hypothetical protein